jgi:DNA-binding cell septation regulator SpoVG
VVRLRLLSLSPPDKKYPANTLAVAAVEFTFDSGEVIVINDWRIVKNANVGPDWVAPPTRWTTPDATGKTKAVPIFVSSRKVLHQVEDLILAEYEKQQTARLDADADDRSAGSSVAGDAQ